MFVRRYRGGLTFWPASRGGGMAGTRRGTAGEAAAICDRAGRLCYLGATCPFVYSDRRACSFTTCHPHSPSTTGAQGHSPRSRERATAVRMSHRMLTGSSVRRGYGWYLALPTRARGPRLARSRTTGSPSPSSPSSLPGQRTEIQARPPRLRTRRRLARVTTPAAAGRADRRMGPRPGRRRVRFKGRVTPAGPSPGPRRARARREAGRGAREPRRQTRLPNRQPPSRRRRRRLASRVWTRRTSGWMRGRLPPSRMRVGWPWYRFRVRRWRLRGTAGGSGGSRGGR
jgi:hypothetical protein